MVISVRRVWLLGLSGPAGSAGSRDHDAVGGGRDRVLNTGQ